MATRKQASTLVTNPEVVRASQTWFYARVSTSEASGKQSLDLQLDCARQLGIPKSHIVTERGSGTRADRPRQSELLANAQAGDTVYCYSVSRWSRNSRHLHETVEEMTSRNIIFKSATEPTISTDSATSRMLLGGRDLAREDPRWAGCRSGAGPVRWTTPSTRCQAASSGQRPQEYRNERTEGRTHARGMPCDRSEGHS